MEWCRGQSVQCLAKPLPRRLNYPTSTLGSLKVTTMVKIRTFMDFATSESTLGRWASYSSHVVLHFMLIFRVIFELFADIAPRTCEKWAALCMCSHFLVSTSLVSDLYAQAKRVARKNQIPLCTTKTASYTAQSRTSWSVQLSFFACDVFSLS